MNKRADQALFQENKKPPRKDNCSTNDDEESIVGNEHTEHIDNENEEEEEPNENKILVEVR